MTLMNKLFVFGLLLVACSLLQLTACNYSFRDVSIPPEVKTIKINYLENKAGYVNPQLSPQLSDKLRQKINNQTRLTQVQGDDAHYEVSGYIADYSVSTAAVSNQQAATNQLTVRVHIIFVNRLDPTGKTVAPPDFEADITQSVPFSASLSLQQAETQLLPTILNNVTDAIFNRLFSNW
jgi:outer membrane lipopolysaccharide assembly protein LptE/RlpB